MTKETKDGIDLKTVDSVTERFGGVKNENRYKPLGSDLLKLDTQQKRMIESMPAKYKKLFVRAYLGTASPRGMAKAKCVDCVGGEDVNIRVAECKTTKCAIYKIRPYQPS